MFFILGVKFFRRSYGVAGRHQKKFGISLRWVPLTFLDVVKEMSIVLALFCGRKRTEGIFLILLILDLNIEQASKDHLQASLKHWPKFHLLIIIHCFNQSHLVFMIAAGFRIAKKTHDGSND